MREVYFSSQFKKDFHLVKKRGYIISKISQVMKYLENASDLPSKYKEHPLTGIWSGYLECHIEPDWLLIYKIVNDGVYFVRTGSHSDLFK